MTPRPDHGEQRYKGTGRLSGRKALITGGDSGIGRAAAIAYAREGADVAINYLPADEEDARGSEDQDARWQSRARPCRGALQGTDRFACANTPDQQRHGGQHGKIFWQ